MKKIPDPCYALGAAFLFALGLPAAKIFLKEIHPIMLSGLFLLGSGTGLTIILWLQSIFNKSTKSPPFDRQDLPLLITVSFLGSLLPSIFLMTAISMVSASSVSLALNLEIVFTSILAWLFFKERVTWLSFGGLIAILFGGICLAWNKDVRMSWPLLLVCGACLSWSIDNNLLRRITKTQPIKIARFRGLFTGTVNMCLSLLLGYHFPKISTIIGTTLTGVACYGLTFTIFVTAIHRLGAIRAIAYFSTVPLIGAFLSVLILKEQVTPNLILAAVFMSIGVWMHMAEKHDYEQAIYPL